jgi:hypothetical protein
MCMKVLGKSKRIYWLVAIILVVVVCGSKLYSLKYAAVYHVQNESRQSSDSVTFKTGEVLSFLLDSITSPASITYCQYFIPHGKKPQLTFLNGETRTIYYYDFATQKNVKRITLTDYDYNYTDKIQGYHLINEDSLFVYNYLNASLSCLSLTHGKRLKKSLYDVSRPFQTRVFPFCTTAAPLVYDKAEQKIVMTGVRADEGGTFSMDKQRNVVSIFNQASGALEYTLPYPEHYWGKNWGGAGGFRPVFSSYNAREHLMIVSFMADHYLTLFDVRDHTQRRVYAGSKYIGDIASMSYSPYYYELTDKNAILEYYCKSPSYTTVIFDSYRQLYYRIAELPLENFELTSAKKTNRPESLIVLNQRFEKIGEFRLPVGVLDTESFIVTEKGLYFKMLENMEPDWLRFQLFELVRQ